MRRVLGTALLLVTLALCSLASAADLTIEKFPLERNKVALHLQRLQMEEAKNLKPLLMVHGLTYSSHEFDVDYLDYSLSRFFARNGYAVWTLDIAGYGSSAKVSDGFMPDSDYAAEDIAAAVQFINEKSGTKKIDILGWSWGTVTSGRFSAKYPELVNKLVLYAPIFTGLVAKEVTVPFNSNTWEHAASDFQVTEDKSIDYSIVEPAVAATFLSNCWRFDGQGSPNGGRRDLLVSPETYLIPTEKITAPVLVIAGTNDDYINMQALKSITAKLPGGSQTTLIEGGAHAMMMERPYYTEFRDAVLVFLNN